MTGESSLSGHDTVSGQNTVKGTAVLSVGLWLALVAAVLQFTALGADFYEVGDQVRDAWFGIPHTSQLILLSALATVVLVALAAGGRSPVSGRWLGIIIGVVGLVATAQLAYRMAVPPFRGCLTFNCGFTPKHEEVTLLTGIWIGLAGNIGATLGGFIHSATAAAERVTPNFWVADRQTGATPWLGVAGLSAALMFLVGYTIMPFYSVPAEEGSASWTAWLSIPHTSGLVLVIAVAVVGMVVAAGRNRSPMSPQGLGITVAVLAFAAGFRTFYRILVSPFYSGPAANAGFPEGAEVHTIAFVSLAFAIVTLIAGGVHALQNREPAQARVAEGVAGGPA